MSESVIVHSTAILDPKAELDSGVEIGAYAIIGPHVKIGKNTKIHHHALILGHTTLGSENEVYSFASVGNVPQDLKYKGEPTTLEIGNNNIIREYVTMQPGTAAGISTTKVGNGNLFMAYVHVAHDCVIGNSNIFANLTQLSGHVCVGNYVVFGGLSAVHQFTRIGDYVMTGGAALIGLDVPPFCVAEGNRGGFRGLRGLNTVGLQRAGLNSEIRTAIKTAYKIVFLDRHATLREAFDKFPKEIITIPQIKLFQEFILDSKRGVMRPMPSRGSSFNES